MATTTTTNDGSSTYRIEPLKGTENYLAWQTQMTDILVDQGNWKYVEGTPPTDPNDLAKWKTDDRKALISIRLQIAAALISHVMSATTAKEAWDAIKTVFTTEGVLAKVLACRKLLRYSIEEGAEIEVEVRQLRKLREEFTMLGGELKDDEFAITVLTALPPS